MAADLELVPRPADDRLHEGRPLDELAAHHGPGPPLS